jgi:hypothetical protein
MCLNEACSKTRIGKTLSDAFPIQDGLKKGDILSPLLYNVPSGRSKETRKYWNWMQQISS